MGVSRVLHDSKMVSFEAQLPDRRGAILKQSRLELRVYPCSRDDLSTPLGSNFIRINLNPSIDGLGINHGFLDEQAFQGLHPKRGL
jgi:hypothetical protein